MGANRNDEIILYVGLNILVCCLTIIAVIILRKIYIKNILLTYPPHRWL